VICKLSYSIKEVLLASESSITLPGFLKFAHDMKPFLTLVQRSELDALLKCFYQAAEQKIELERRRKEIQEDDGRTIREKKKSMSQARKLLNHALRNIKKAKVEHSEALVLVEGSIFSLEDECFSFRGSIQFLEAAVECADKYQLVFAGLIHPRLRRRPVEKRQAEQELAEGVAAGAIASHQYPASPDSPDIDHWFIGAAAECLDRCTTGTGKKIPAYDGIIQALFRVAFQDVERSAESIRIELRRQKKDGAPRYLFLIASQPQRQ
jgi:hypothetical protein